MSIARVLIWLAAIAIACAALPLAAEVAIPAAATSGTYSVISAGSAYGMGRTQRVTIVRPDTPGRRPVAVMIHGGGWVRGSRSAWSREAVEWASRGWVVVNADYTRGVEDGVPGDGRQIIADIQTLVQRYAAAGRADRSRMVIVGDSAGGHLATLTAAKMRGWFRGAIAWSPVAVPANASADAVEDTAAVDAPDVTAQVKLLGRNAAEFFGYSQRTTSALAYVAAYQGQVPPMLIIASKGEWVSYARQGAVLCQALAAKCTSRLVDGTAHGIGIRDADPALAEYARNWALKAIKK